MGFEDVEEKQARREQAPTLCIDLIWHFSVGFICLDPFS